MAALALDYQGQPFAEVPQLLSRAEVVHKLHAICTVCRRSASFSQRTCDEKSQVLVGASGQYEPRCRQHFEPFSNS